MIEWNNREDGSPLLGDETPDEAVNEAGDSDKGVIRKGVSFIHQLGRVLRNEEGSSNLEHGLILPLMLKSFFGFFTTLGKTIKKWFQSG